MSLAIADILNDSLVKETIKTLADKTHRSVPDAADLAEHPILQMLEKAGALDSVTAAVLVAEEMTRGGANAAGAIAFLPPQVAAAARLLVDSGSGDKMEGISALVQDGNPTALKLAVTLIAFTGTGREFDRAQRQMGKSEQQEMARDMLDLSIEILGALNDSKRWKGVEPSLLKTFIEGVENLAPLAVGKFRKELLASSVTALKTGLAADGIDLKTTGIAAPAPQVPHTASLKLSDVLADPLVQETVASLGLDELQVDLTRNPAFAALANANTLDSITAASLIALEAGRHRSGNLPKPVQEVVNLLGNDAIAYLGPLAMFDNDNHTVHKVGVAMLAAGLTGPQFDKEISNLSRRQLKEQSGEMLEAGLTVIERVIEAKSWQSMSPELITQFTQGMESLKSIVGGETRKKLLTLAVQSLKSEIVKGTAAEITGPVAGTSGPGVSTQPKPKKGALKP